MELTLDHVTKTIGSATIIDNISAHWSSGHAYGLVGYNGSGKTMLMRLISGLIFPTSGSIAIDGALLGKDFEFPPSLGIMIENPGFLESFTGFENLNLLAQIKKSCSQQRIRDTIYGVGLDPDDRRKYRKYSLGMKQRLGIAAAIMERPSLLILDEPTNALDAAGVKMVIDLVRQEKERGALVVLACHEKEYLDEMADVVYTIEHGRFTEECWLSKEGENHES